MSEVIYTSGEIKYQWLINFNFYNLEIQDELYSLFNSLDWIIDYRINLFKNDYYNISSEIITDKKLNKDLISLLFLNFEIQDLEIIQNQEFNLSNNFKKSNIKNRHKQKFSKENNDNKKSIEKELAITVKEIKKPKSNNNLKAIIYNKYLDKIRNEKNYIQQLFLISELRKLLGFKEDDIIYQLQNINYGIKTKLMKNKNQLLPIFLEDSLIEDNIIYSQYDINGYINKLNKYYYKLFNNIEIKNEEKIIEILIKNNAQVQENKVLLPNYESVHDIKGGKRIILEEENIIISYVPFNSTSIIYGKEFIHNYKIKLNDLEIEKLINDLDNYYLDQKPKIYYSQYGYSYTKQMTFNKENFILAIDENKKRKFINLNKLEEKDQRVLNNILKSKKKYWKKQFVRYATDKEIQNYSDFKKFKGNYYINKYDLTEYKSLRRNLSKAFKDKEIEIKLSNRQEFDYLEKNPDLLTKKLLQQLNIKGTSEYNSLNKILNFNKLFKLEITEQEGRLTEEQEAILSERGLLNIETKDPLLAINRLKELKIISEPLKKIPINKIPGINKQGIGKITKYNLDLYIGKEKLVLPQNKMIMHSLILDYYDYNPDDENSKEKLIKKRLDSIIKYNGLKSIEQRRKLGIIVNSLSPIGDIASGIDQGVSNIFYDKTYYGSDIIFVTDLKALLRDQMFFSNNDYGAGSDRLNAYNNYAKKLGLKDINQSPTKSARKIHFSKGLKDDSNEIYLKDQITLDELNCIIVQEKHYDLIKQLINEYKLENLVPKSLEIISVKNTYNEDFKKLIQLRNKQSIDNLKDEGYEIELV